MPYTCGTHHRYTHVLHHALGEGVEGSLEVRRVALYETFPPDRVLRIVLVNAPDHEAHIQHEFHHQSTIGMGGVCGTEFVDPYLYIHIANQPYGMPVTAPVIPRKMQVVTREI